MHNDSLCHGTLLRSFAAVASCCLMLPLCGCQKPTVETKKTAPVSPAKTSFAVSEVNLNTIELTDDAIRRLGVEHQPIVERNMPQVRAYGAEVVLPTGASVLVSAPVAGMLKLQENRILPGPGNQIEKGTEVLQLLPLLSPERDVLTPAERVRFAEVRNTIAQSQNDAAAQVEQSKVQVEAAQIALERAERLLKDKSGTIRAVDEATAQLKLAEAALEAAEARKEIVDGIKLDAEEGTLKPISIVSPISGIVRSIQTQPGQIVAAGSAMFEIMDNKVFWVRVPVYVGDLEGLDLTAEARIAAPGKLQGSTVIDVKPITVPPTAFALASTVDVYYELPNENAAYRPGQRLSVQIRLKGESTQTAIPWSAIYLDIYGNQWVYERMGQSTFVRRRVEVAFVADGWAALKHSPPLGTEIVTAAVAELAGTEFGFAK